MDQLNNPSLSALKQVFQQQAMGQSGALDQNNPAQSVPAPGLPQKQMPMPQMGGGGATPPPQPMSPQSQPTGLPIGNPESDIILKALSKRLETISKLDSAKLGI